LELIDGDVIEVCIDAGDDVTESDESNNCVSETFDDGATSPDLTVTSVYLDDSNYVVYVVTNEGDEDIDIALNGEQTISVDGALVETYSWSDLEDTTFLTAGGSSTLSTDILIEGTSTVDVCVDTTNVTEDGAESNNCMSAELTAVLEGADLVVTDIYLADTNVVYYTVENQGDTDIDDTLDGRHTIAVDGEIKNNYFWSLLADLDFLEAGGSVDFGTSADLDSGTHTVEVCVDTENVAEESDDSNNCLSEDFTIGSTDEEGDETTMTVEAGVDQSLTLGDTLTLDDEAYLENLSGADTPTATIDWGDGDSEDATVLTSSPIYIQGSHTYSAAGTYTVTVCATDSNEGVELGTVCDTFTATVSESEDDDDDSSGGSSGGGSNSTSSRNKPDLSVEDIYIQSDGDIIAVLANEGDEDVDDDEEVRVKLSIDGDTEWTQDYNQDSDDDFLDEGEESEINMGDLFDEEDETYAIKVCVDTENDVKESRESNNCRTENLSIDDDAGDEGDDDVTLSSDDEEDDCDNYFYDTDGHWAEGEVCNLYNRDVVEGRKRHYYIPNDSVTRAEFLKIALLNAGLDVESVRSADDFWDVDSNDWFYSYVTFARDLGIVDDNDGEFRPDEDITRAEAMAVLVRLELDGDDLDDLLDQNYDDSDIDFNDVDEDTWFAPYIVYGQDEDLIQGYSNGAFRPENRISRAEAAEIAYNLYRNRY
jgi:hypothetical protein